MSNIDGVTMHKEDVLEKSFHHWFRDQYHKNFKH